MESLETIEAAAEIIDPGAFAPESLITELIRFVRQERARQKAREVLALERPPMSAS